jgi:peptidoglycan/LPS O-acetylase OafA/YrhL
VGKRLDNLQALRGVACLLVVVYHTAGIETFFGLRFSPLHPAQWFGYAGVDLFFVLSGFIIASTSRADLGAAARLPRYVFRRLWRIFPAYWAALVFAVAYYAWSNPRPVFGTGWPAEWLDTLLLLPQPGGCRFLPVAWTLSYELMFYLAFAALFLLPRRAAVPAVAAWAVAVLALAVAGHRPGNRFAVLWVSPFVLEFLAGVAVAWCPVRFGGRAAVGLVAAAVAWGAVGTALAFDSDPARLTYTYPLRVAVFGPAAALVVLAAVGWERSGGQIGRRWLRHVGDASYSIYLTHIPALLGVLYVSMSAGWSHRKFPHLVWVGAMLTAGVASGLLFHRFVERPLLRLAERRRPAAGAEPGGVPEPVRRAA